MMRLQFIVCKVLQREAYFCAARSKNIVDVVLMPQGLHNEPDKLRSEIQKALERTCDCHARAYNASLLGYGLCRNGIVGLSAKIPIVAARAHDCITLLLGSRERYRQYFDSHRGVYWYSPGWIEAGDPPGRQRYERTLKEYEEKYGPEKAGYPRRRAGRVLADHAVGDRIVRKADGGRRPNVIREIPVVTDGKSRM